MKVPEKTEWENLHCECGNDQFEAQTAWHGWLHLKCTECGNRFRPDKRENFAEFEF